MWIAMHPLTTLVGLGLMSSVCLLSGFETTASPVEENTVPSPNEAKAEQYLRNQLEAEYSTICNQQAEIRWSYVTNVTKETEAASVQALNKYTEYQRQVQAYITANFPDWNTYSPNLRREFKFLFLRGPGNLTADKVEELNKLGAEMESAYAAAKVCKYGQTDPSTCEKFNLEPEITDKIKYGTDFDELAYYWTAWHDALATATPTSKFKRFMDLQNEGAKAMNFDTGKDYWIESYDDGESDFTTQKFTDEIAKLWDQLRPHYELIHAYVRMKLRQNPLYKDKMSPTGCIPANLLGNMWAQEWTMVGKTTKPYPNVGLPDATDAMKSKGYTPLKMFQTADEFFQGLGLEGMTDTFWSKSMIERPKDGRDVVCHASSEDFCLGKGSKDFRIKMCTSVNQEDLVVIHHEMGHIEYFMQYTNRSITFRDGANPGFHEAIGDTLALAVSTPKHLQCALGLPIGMDSLCTSETGAPKISEQDINFLYFMALEKLVFYPFAYSMDSWRWGIFDGSIPEEEYNSKWWEIRGKLQGIQPPIPRNSSSPGLDAAAKYHIVANVEYIRYFVSHILQFQFFESMCIAAGQYDPANPSSRPLHQCDFSGSKEAGKLIGDMMRLGFSQPWPVALEAIAGTKQLSTDAVIKYFQPLFDVLQKSLDDNNESVGFSCT